MAAIDTKKKQREIITNLTTIFSAGSMAQAFLQPDFQSIVEKQLNILAYLEKKNKSKTLKSASLLKKYNELAKKSFVIDKNIAYSDEDVLIDDINYLSIYVRNIYKVDIQALSKGEDAKVPTPTVTETPTQSSNPMPFPFVMPGMTGDGNNFMQSTMASVRIKTEAAQGKVYLYKTKPKMMVIVKIIIAICLTLCAIASIIIGVGMEISVSSKYLSSYFENGDTSGLRYEAITYFLFAACVLFQVYPLIAPILYKNTKRYNENRAFHFSWQYFIWPAILFSFVLIFGLSSGDKYIFMLLPWNNKEDPSNINIGLWLAFIGYICFLSFFGLTIIFSIVASTINPKTDNERLDALTKQYMEEMSSKSPPPPGAPPT